MKMARLEYCGLKMNWANVCDFQCFALAPPFILLKRYKIFFFFFVLLVNCNRIIKLTVYRVSFYLFERWIYLDCTVNKVLFLSKLTMCLFMIDA